MSDRYDSLACEAAAHERANAAEAEVERLRGLLAKSEETVKSVHEFSHAKTDEIKRLKGLLAEAEEAIREAADEVGGEPEFSDERCSYETIQVSYGWRKEWRESAPVQRALKGASS